VEDSIRGTSQLVDGEEADPRWQGAHRAGDGIEEQIPLVQPNPKVDGDGIANAGAGGLRHYLE
jgi:hypothetical protein